MLDRPIDNPRPAETGKSEAAPFQKVDRRPEGSPKSKKDFKEVVDKDKKVKDESDEDEGSSSETRETASSRSIFDLSRKKGTAFNEEGGGQQSDTSGSFAYTAGLDANTRAKRKPAAEALSRDAFSTDQPDIAAISRRPGSSTMADLAGGKSLKRKFGTDEELPTPVDPSAVNPANIQSNAANVRIQGEAPINIKSRVATNSESELEGIHEVGERSSVDPRMMQAVPQVAQADTHAAVNTPSKSEAANRVAQIQEIVDQIVDKIYTLKAGGKTDTTIELKNIPLFEGAKITVTSYDSASKEFNISFTNLSAQAQRILEQPDNMSALKQSLDSQGITVHMVMTTTQADTPIMAENREQQQQRQRDGEREQGGGGSGGSDESGDSRQQQSRRQR
jgi:hypothetical protein